MQKSVCRGQVDAVPIGRRRLDLKFAAAFQEANTRRIVVMLLENRHGRSEIPSGVSIERSFIRSGALPSTFCKFEFHRLFSTFIKSPG
jgi:hypothetical protein